MKRHYSSVLGFVILGLHVITYSCTIGESRGAGSSPPMTGTPAPDTSSASTATPDPSLEPSAGPEPTLEPPPEPPVTASLAESDCANGRASIVRRAIDGDTIEINEIAADGYYESVRLIGIDTPELNGGESPECYAEEATAATDLWVDNTTVCLTLDPAVEEDSGSVDVYGRTLAYVFFGESFEQFLNADLVSQGYARAATYTDGTVYANYFYDLQDYAQQYDLGRWSYCP